MHGMKAMAGLNDVNHDTASSIKFANMRKRLDSKIFFSEGNRTKKFSIPYQPYYGKIWGKAAIVNHPFLSLQEDLGRKKNTNEQNTAAHEGWPELARILLSFPKFFAEEIGFWKPLFLAVHGRPISECLPPKPDKESWHDKTKDLSLGAIAKMFEP